MLKVFFPSHLFQVLYPIIIPYAVDMVNIWVRPALVDIEECQASGTVCLVVYLYLCVSLGDVSPRSQSLSSVFYSAHSPSEYTSVWVIVKHLGQALVC